MANQPPIYSHLGAAANRASNIVTKVHQENQYLEIVDRLIEPQTVVTFVEFCHSGILPTGQKTSLDRPTDHELDLMHTSPNPAVDERSIMDCVMDRVGCLEDGDRLCIVGKNIQSMRNRMCAGIIPLSEQRWKEKGLDKRDNIELACEYLTAVLAAWEYLNRPRVAKNLRDTFNLMGAHWGELDTMINLTRGQSGQPLISVARLWTEFMQAHVNLIAERSHRWVVVHVNSLRAPILQDLASHRSLNPDVLDGVQWKLTDRLQLLGEIVAVADYAIMIPMHGYKGYIPPPAPPGIPAGLRSPEFDVRRSAYGPRLKEVTRKARYEDLMTRMSLDETFTPSDQIGDPVSLRQTISIQIASQIQVRRELRGDPIEPIPREPWISLYLREPTQRENLSRGRGLVVYRLTYKQSEEEWTGFVQKLEEHMVDWGTGQTGSGALKPYLKLHWRDGRALGIREGDIEGVRKHYNDHYSQNDIPFKLEGHINKRAFLVIDEASFASYTSKSYSAATHLVQPGDFMGFVLAIDTEWDPEEGPERPNESPGYQGHMRIVGSLVWGDLFAMLSSQSAILQDLWPLAMDHPNFVYVGPLVPLQIKSWRRQNKLRDILFEQIFRYAEAKMNGNAWPVPQSSSVPQSQGVGSSATDNGASSSPFHAQENDPIQDSIFRDGAPQATPSQIPDMNRTTRQGESGRDSESHGELYTPDTDAS